MELDLATPVHMVLLNTVILAIGLVVTMVTMLSMAF